MNYNVIASGSTGNSVLLNDEFLVDIGIPFKLLKNSINIDDVKALFITHYH